MIEVIFDKEYVLDFLKTEDMEHLSTVEVAWNKTYFN
jgi:hypothetical protein